MANHSITVTNTLAFQGHGYPTRWNAFTWNAASWGNSADSEVRVEKQIDSTVTPASEVGKAMVHAIDVEALAFVSEILNAFSLILNNTLSMTSDPYSQVLTDSNGYTHVFPSNATDGEDRDIPTWAGGTGASTTWTSSAAVATSWS